MDDADVYKRQEEGDRPVEKSPRGRYIRFDVRLGTGAYKSVYKAYDTDQGIDVAWNAIDIGVLPATEKTRIIQEVQLLQKLEHKNIINFYGSWFSKEKNQVVFITEIMTSGTLKSYIKRVQFIKWKIIKRWCGQILEGLHYLHNQNPPVIHRDLKCDNIFINGNTGDLRIGDLGLSTQLAVHKRSKAQSVLGTPEFMAPELYDESYDEKVDIYAFGMCVLEMVTKEVPYSECINPAQIYKKVTAGIRPKGLQRVVSQAARDFIELCLSRGNGLVDVSAEYLLAHPFLKPSDDDGDMVQLLDEDELEREVKVQQEKLARVSEETFAVQLDMESASKSADGASVTDRRKQFPTLSLEPEELSGDTSGTKEGAPSAESDVAIQAEEKSAGKRHLVSLPQMKDAIAGIENQSAPPTPATSPSPPPTAAVADPPSAPTSSGPIISESFVDPDEPRSGRRDGDGNVDEFLATMPGSEIRIQNTRMKLMGGRDHLFVPEDDAHEEEAEENGSGVSTSVTDDVRSLSSVPDEVSSAPLSAPTSASASAQPPLDVIAPAPASAPSSLPPPTPSPTAQSDGAPRHVPAEPSSDFSSHRRPSLHSLSEDLPLSSVELLRSESGNGLSNNSNSSRPPSASSSTSSIASSTRRRAKRHEIKAAKDPENEHSILLNLRIMIDGKSKEIKFPFNLFTDSTHEVACELAVDVGILEPDLEDIADSIRFLVTEGKINNLRDEQVDVWEEAPEPRSFSSKVLPPVSKMSVVQAPSSTPALAPQQSQSQPQTPQTPHMMPGTPLDRPQTVPIFSLGEQAHHNALASHPPVLNMAANGGGEGPSQTAVPSMMTLDPTVPNVSIAMNGTTTPSTVTYPSLTESTPRSPSHGGLSHAASESTLSTEALLSKLELRERGVSIGSLKDPHYIQKVHNFEDRMKVARSAFDERESTLEAAIRSEEEKHQREIERFRKKMEEFNKQRAAIARQQNGSVNGSANGEVLELVDGTLLTPPAPPLSIVTDSNGSMTLQGVDGLSVSVPPQMANYVNGGAGYDLRSPRQLEMKSANGNSDGTVPVSLPDMPALPNEAQR